MHTCFLMIFQGPGICSHSHSIEILAPSFKEAYKKAEKIFQEKRPAWAKTYILGPMYERLDFECFGLPEITTAFSEIDKRVAEAINNKEKENKIVIQISTNGTLDTDDIVIRRI